MMMKGYNPENIRFGNSFSHDGFPARPFDYMLTNPPFGVDWKKVEATLQRVPGSHLWYELTPVSLHYWAKAVENAGVIL